MSSPNGNTTCNLKVVLLGEGCVGKTSLLLRYIEDKFNDKHLSTVQATFLNKKININGKRINLSIWDTAGQEKFHALGPIYYRNSNGAILVYDITDEDSFLKVKNWVKELKKMLGSEIVLVIVGNKIDLEHERTVPLEEAESYANMVGAKHYYTSAKLNQGVEELFLNLTREMVDRVEQNSNVEVPRPSRVLVVDDEVPAQSSCCCYANMVGAKHYYTSAKLNQGVEELFLNLTREMVDRVEQNSNVEVPRPSRVLVVDDEVPAQSSCCWSSHNN